MARRRLNENSNLLFEVNELRKQARRLSETVAKVVKLPEVLARFQLDALEPSAQGAQSLGRFLAQDFTGWQKVVAAQNIKVDAV